MRTASNGMTPLMSAIARHTFYLGELGPPVIVRSLLENGAPVNLHDDRGRTALHYIAESDHPDIIQSLVEYGAGVNAQDVECSTPLHYVARQIDENLELRLDGLLSHGANPFVPDLHGQSALHLLCETEAGHAYVASRPQYFARESYK